MPSIYKRYTNNGNTTIDRLQIHQHQESQEVKIDNIGFVSGQLFENATEDLSEDFPISGQFDDADTDLDLSPSNSKDVPICGQFDDAEECPDYSFVPIRNKATDQEKTASNFAPGTFAPQKNDSTTHRNIGFKRMVSLSSPTPPLPKRSCSFPSKIESRKPTGLDFLASAVAVKSIGWQMENNCGQGDSHSEKLSSQFQSKASDSRAMCQPPRNAQYPRPMKPQNQHYREQQYWPPKQDSAFSASPYGQANGAVYASAVHKTRPYPGYPIPAISKTSVVNEEKQHFWYKKNTFWHSSAAANPRLTTPLDPESCPDAPDSCPSLPPSLETRSPFSHTLQAPKAVSSVSELGDKNKAERCPNHKIETATYTFIKPNRCDVLFGRGGKSNNHYGNMVFRTIIREHKDAYLKCGKYCKSQISKAIVSAIVNQDPPGRFLARHPNASKLKAGGDDDCWWYEVDNKRAVEKVSQALREKKSTPKGTNSTSGETKAPFEPPKIVFPNNSTIVDECITGSSSITEDTSLDNLPEAPPSDRPNSHIRRITPTNGIDIDSVMESSNDKANAIRIAANRNINHALCKRENSFQQQAKDIDHSIKSVRSMLQDYRK